MKRYQPATYLLFSGILFLAACSGAHKVQGTNLNGTWKLTSVSIAGDEKDTKYKTTVFDDAPANCFNGSVWNLPNNGNGSYTLQPLDSTCTGGQRNIVWSVATFNGNAFFQFKRLNGGAKAKDITAGYRLAITSVTSGAFSLRDSIAVDNSGQSVNMLYNFTRQ